MRSFDYDNDARLNDAARLIESDEKQARRILHVIINDDPGNIATMEMTCK